MPLIVQIQTLSRVKPALCKPLFWLGSRRRGNSTLPTEMASLYCTTNWLQVYLAEFWSRNTHLHRARLVPKLTLSVPVWVNMAAVNMD